MKESESTVMAHAFAKTIAKIAEFAVELAETLHKDLGLEYQGPLVSKAKLVNKKRLRVDRDPNEPKRPSTSYMLFTTHIREELKKKGEPQPQMKDLGEMWNKLDDSEKEKYNGEAQKLKEQYDKDMAEFRTKKGSVVIPATGKSDESEDVSEELEDVAPPTKVQLQ
jgi:hypothetical protein